MPVRARIETWHNAFDNESTSRLEAMASPEVTIEGSVFPYRSVDCPMCSPRSAPALGDHTRSPVPVDVLACWLDQSALKVRTIAATSAGWLSITPKSLVLDYWPPSSS